MEANYKLCLRLVKGDGPRYTNNYNTSRSQRLVFGQGLCMMRKKITIHHMLFGHRNSTHLFSTLLFSQSRDSVDKISGLVDTFSTLFPIPNKNLIFHRFFTLSSCTVFCYNNGKNFCNTNLSWPLSKIPTKTAFCNR